jgi:hypothetical protein
VSFVLNASSTAKKTLEELQSNPAQAAKLKKLQKAFALLEANPRHPGLQSHQYESLAGPNGEKVWESYVENRTPGAWRIWWWYGPGKNELTVLAIGPHPD